MYRATPPTRPQEQRSAWILATLYDLYGRKAHWKQLFSQRIINKVYSKVFPFTRKWTALSWPLYSLRRR
jgi:hypothetical protein